LELSQTKQVTVRFAEFHFAENHFAETISPKGSFAAEAIFKDISQKMFSD
jgi:hypothetical protein